MVNKSGIPETCPHCGVKAKDGDTIEVNVADYDPMWHDGKVVCAGCGGFIRSYDAG
jgi:acetamidase/formamidase